MTRFAAITAAATLMATSAMAYTGVSPTMLSSVTDILDESGFSVDITTLTDEQVIEIYAAGQGGTSNEQINKIRAALDGEGQSRVITERRVIIVGDDADEEGLFRPGMENSVTASVQNWLDKNGYEVDASMLSDAQLAEIYLYIYGGSDKSNDENFVDRIIAG